MIAEKEDMILAILYKVEDFFYYPNISPIFYSCLHVIQLFSILLHSPNITPAPSSGHVVLRTLEVAQAREDL